MNRGIKTIIKKLPYVDRYFYGKKLYAYYKNEHHEYSRGEFVRHNYKRIRLIRQKDGKHKQIVDLIDAVDLCPSENADFFYSIDPYKRLILNNQILDNYSIDYSWVVNSSFTDTLNLLDNTSAYGTAMGSIVDALQGYVNRLKAYQGIDTNSIAEIESLFSRPAKHFHEAIQRILFVNQWLWQSAHKHMGYGHLDWILYDLYKKDIEEGYITRENAREYLISFFNVLHENCWFKSTMLLGDTGQIVILGGLKEGGTYRCNELTYLFIEVSKALELPDPKVLLRVSKNMPDKLLKLALECIATGIGAPFISNDDAVIPSLIQFGYNKEDAYNYATSACWEPFTIGKSCDQNNIRTVNFCEPLVKFFDSDEFEKCQSIEEIEGGYYRHLHSYLDSFLTVNLDNKVFEEDPLLTLFNPEILKSGKDIVRGGAKYNNLGLTSVGMSTVVNSIINLEHFVFQKKMYTLHDLNEMRKKNYEGHEEIRNQLNMGTENYGNDSDRVISLTNEIMHHVSSALEKHHTCLGGKYKYGLSSPNYIVGSKNMGATFDGRKNGQPFGVHISGKNGLSPTELICFASKLDYYANRINGNVVDFILTPYFIRNNIDKVVALIKGGIRQGFFQLQINVVDSKTLIEAQKHPEQFPNLVVRVWGFSAYFKDLPKDYQDNLIKRALDAEKAS